VSDLTPLEAAMARPFKGDRRQDWQRVHIYDDVTAPLYEDLLLARWKSDDEADAEAGRREAAGEAMASRHDVTEWVQDDHGDPLLDDRPHPGGPRWSEELF